MLLSSTSALGFGRAYVVAFHPKHRKQTSRCELNNPPPMTSEFMSYVFFLCHSDQISGLEASPKDRQEEKIHSCAEQHHRNRFRCAGCVKDRRTFPATVFLRLMPLQWYLRPLNRFTSHIPRKMPEFTQLMGKQKTQSLASVIHRYLFAHGASLLEGSPDLIQENDQESKRARREQCDVM